MRTLSLAQELQSRGHQLVFAGRRATGSMHESIRAAGFPALELPVTSGDPWLGCTQGEDAERTQAAAGGRFFDWIVVDHYKLGLEWHACMRSHCRRLLAIDDLADRPHDVDLLLDVNLYDDMESRYAGRLKDPATPQLLGPRYALLRKEFEELRRRPVAPRHILIFFGGSDPSNATTLAVEAARSTDLTGPFLVVLGASNPHQGEVMAALAGDPRFECRVSPPDFAQLLQASSLVLGSGGGITWERCCLGIPALVLAIAPNQEELSVTAGRHGLHRYAGRQQDVDVRTLAALLSDLWSDAGTRLEMAERGRKLVDGRGTQRVAEKLETLSQELQ